MDASPAIESPRVGDPITAAWADRVSEAVNSAAIAPEGNGATQTPFGTASPTAHAPQMDGAEDRPMPFDTRLFGADGTTELYVALPSDVADYVWLGPDPVSPDGAQTLGTSDSAWVSLGPIDRSVSRFVYLAFVGEQDDETDKVNVTGWRVFVADSANDRPEWAAPFAPLVLLAAYRVPVDGTEDARAPNLRDGLCQYHHGTIVAPFVQPEPGEKPKDNVPPCGNPLNDDSDYNPLDNGGGSSSTGGGGGGAGVTHNPLDDPGDGGFTPTCAEDNLASNND